MDFSTKMIHSCARWEPTGTLDAYGKRTYSENDIIVCRWMSKRNLIIDAEGKEYVSDTVIYTNTEISPETYFEFNDTITGNTTPYTRINAYLARKIETHYDVSGKNIMYKVYL